jgi:branched-chain amino acid aminotransferase
MAEPMVWINGELLPEPDAAISPFDHGFLVGDGVFETCKVVGGRAFALRRHLERLARSAEGLGLELPGVVQLHRAVAATIAENGEDRVGRLRIVATGGPGALGSARSGGLPTVVILATPADPWPVSAPVVVVPWTRNEHGATAGLKTTSYAENVVALTYANARGGDEALFFNTAGNLCEGTGSNVFVGVGGRLVTPPLTSGCLAGITRELLLELGVAEETDVSIAGLTEADEAFLSSSTREIQPIARIDARDLPSCPGPLTDVATQAFADLVARDLDP